MFFSGWCPWLVVSVRTWRGSDFAVERDQRRTVCGFGRDRITQRVGEHRDEVFNDLFCLLTRELLFYACRKFERDKVPGVDGVTVSQYEETLRTNLLDHLEARLHRGACGTQLSLRREISKGNGKTRPLGIASAEDKIIQRAIVMALEP